MDLVTHRVMAAPDTTALAAAILNAAWLVRYFSRSKTRRNQAILKLGVTVRDAFNKSDDYEKLLEAVVDGLRPKDNRPF